MNVVEVGAGERTAAVQRAAIERAAAIFMDWDGCIMRGAKIDNATRHFLAIHRDRIAIVSNNSTQLPAEIAAMVARAGIVIAADRIILAGVETLRYAAQRPSRRVMMFGSRPMLALAQRLGITLVRDHADTVVLLRDLRFSYVSLERAANALAAGAEFIVSNGDLAHPGPAGAIVPETGALRIAIRAAIPDVDVCETVIGKPAPALFLRAAAAMGVRPEAAVMIGDNPDTDVAGASLLGMRSVLVGARSQITIADLLDSPPAEPRGTNRFKNA